jgi:hypothetical protein
MDKIISYKEEFLHPDLTDYLCFVNNNYYVIHFLISYKYPVYPDDKSESNSQVNETYLHKSKLYKEYLINKDYKNIQVLLDKEKQMDWFIDNYIDIYEDLGETEYYRLLRETLVYVDEHYLYREFYSELINIGNDPRLMMSENEMRMFNELPDEFVVYRGINSNKKISKINLKELLGNSWSLDREVSIWFGKVYSNKFRKSKFTILLKYLLTKREIISYFIDRNEEEIFLDYDTIDIDKVSVEYIPKDYELKLKINLDS